MRLRTFALAALALTLALPAAATERRDANASVERLRSEILLQTELARSILGDEAADLLQERARFARRISQLELVAEDGYLVTEQVLNQGGDAGELLLRSPSAVLVRQQSPRTQGTQAGRTWTRGSWMDSPDGAS